MLQLENNNFLFSLHSFSRFPFFSLSLSLVTRQTFHRGGSRATAKSKMKCFVIIVNGFHPDVAVALDPPLLSALDIKIFFRGILNDNLDTLWFYTDVTDTDTKRYIQLFFICKVKMFGNYRDEVYSTSIPSKPL